LSLLGGRHWHAACIENARSRSRLHGNAADTVPRDLRAGRIGGVFCVRNPSRRHRPVTPDQAQLVKQSFAKVAPIAEQAAGLFYTRLFETAPEVKPLFTGDIREQGRKLMATIGLAVSSLDRLPQLVPVVQDLGRKHAGYGVRDEHYDKVGAALLWTLEQGLGADFTPETRAAWAEVYTILASVMKEAARQPA
jgi:nitric oxide dioxygenase